jgi:hypothetical protein
MSRETAIGLVSPSRPPFETKLYIMLCQPELVLSVVSSFEGSAIVREKFLPSGGKPGRKNSRLRSPTGRQFHAERGRKRGRG